MKPFLSTLTIKHRIYWSFALVVMFSVLISVFNIDSLTSFHNHFKRYKNVSDDASMMLRIDNDLAELRRLIVTFSHNGQIASIGDLNDLHEKMREDISQLIDQYQFNDKSDLVRLKQMQASVKSFGERFSSLDKQRNLRDDYINHQLIDSFTKINHQMAALSNAIADEPSKLLIQHLWETQLAISKAESISADYFNSRQFEAKKSVETELSKAADNLIKALPVAKGKTIKQKISHTTTSVQDAKTTFIKASQADRNYLFLLNIVIAGESAELSILSETLKEKSLATQQEIYTDIEENIVSNNRTAIVVSILISFVAFIFALLISRLVTKPLASITRTFTSLAHGEQIDVIPGVERGDEIGYLARAADVFNKTNLQTTALLDESERITESLKISEDQLKNKNEDLKNFTHIASHDLKSPIQGISDLTLWIEEDLGDDIPEEVKANLARVRLRIERMQSLIDDLLKYSQYGIISEDISMIDVPAMIDDILSLISMPPAFKFNINGELSPFECYQTPLQITLRNLLSNAIKHHDKTNGNISINLAEKTEYYIFEVQDNGPGIAKDKQKDIFLLFQTGESAVISSTGMGLAFCKRLVEVHGGGIEVESALGEGATFRIWWPKKIIKSL